MARACRLGEAQRAPVAELVDALDSKSSSARSVGSTPTGGTSRKLSETRPLSRCDRCGVFPALRLFQFRTAGVRRLHSLSGEGFLPFDVLLEWRGNDAD